jgi:uncharacterized protein (TIGR00106 family)
MPLVPFSQNAKEGVSLRWSRHRKEPVLQQFRVQLSEIDRGRSGLTFRTRGNGPTLRTEVYVPIMEISVVPVGTASPSVSTYVAACIKGLRRRKDVAYRLTPMGTIVQARSVGYLLRIARTMHESVLNKGAPRVVTSLRIDDRVDKALTMDGKIRSVRRASGPTRAASLVH